jgi:hypothetical protein
VTRTCGLERPLHHNGIFWRRLFRSIDLWPTFDPLRLSLVQNCPLEDTLDALRELEEEELVWRTKRSVTIPDAELRENDWTLCEHVNRIGDEVVEQVRIYERTENWEAFYSEWKRRNEEADASAKGRTVERARALRHKR